MTNPSPGFDLYLERFWHDFQERFVTYAAEALTPRYRVRIDERSLVATIPSSMPQRVFYPDIAVTERITPSDISGATTAKVTIVQTETETDLDEPIISGTGQRTCLTSALDG